MNMFTNKYQCKACDDILTVSEHSGWQSCRCFDSTYEYTRGFSVHSLYHRGTKDMVFRFNGDFRDIEPVYRGEIK